MNKMKIDQIKYDIHKHFRWMYNITLTQSQLDDINDFYHELRKQALKDVILYRFINMMIGVIFLLLFFVFEGSPKDSWFVFTMLTVFVFYNKIHAIIDWMRYKRIKPQPRPSDED